MAKISMVLGVLLIALGVIGYFAAGDEASWTALIPSLFGLIFLGLGGVALQTRYLKIAMHVAIIVAALGVVATFMRVLPVFTRAKEIENALAFGSQLTMCILCVLFIALSVISFAKVRSGAVADPKKIIE